MPVLERSALEDSSLADLYSIASELSIDNYRTLRREDLIEKIINGQQSPKTPTRRSTSSRPRRDSSRSSSSRERSPRERSSSSSKPEEGKTVEGLVEIRRGGSAFLRLSKNGPTDEDPYISAAQVRRCELKKDDKVSGPVRPPRRSERYPSLLRVESVNGKRFEGSSTASPRSRDKQTVVAQYPTKLFGFSGDAELSKVEKSVPFGFGSRVAIVGGAFSGKSELLKKIAAQLKGRSEIDLKVVLTDLRPEEVAEWKSLDVNPVATIESGSKDTERMSAVRKTLQAAKRSFRTGKNVVVLIDSLAGLGKEFAVSSLSEARNHGDSGSLTVIAANDVPVGGESTVIGLSTQLASARKYPAIDFVVSGSLKAEKLLDSRDLKAAAKVAAKAIR